MRHIYLCLGLCATWGLAVQAQETDLRGSDAAEQAGDIDRALNLLRPLQRADADDPQVAKRLSRLYTRKIEDTQVPSERKAFAAEAIRLGEVAVQQLPNDAEAHVGLAAAIGEMTNLVDSRSRVELSKRVYREAMRTLELDASNDYAHLILARWNFEVATINPLLKGFAQVVYGQLPGASKEEAVAQFRRAIALAPYRVIHHAEYAKVLATLGDANGAREQWQETLQARAVDAQDRRYQAIAQRELRR